MEYPIFKKGKLRKITSDRKKEIGFCIDIYTICQLYTQLLRNIRQQKKNGKKSPALKGCPQRRGTCARVYVRLVQIMNSNR